MLVIFYFLNSEQTESSHKVSFALSSTVNREFCKGQLYGNWGKKKYCSENSRSTDYFLCLFLGTHS